MDIVRKMELKDQGLISVSEFQTDLEGVAELFRDGELQEALIALGELHTKMDKFGWLFMAAVSPLNVPPTPEALKVD